MQFIPYAERGGSDGFSTFYEFINHNKEIEVVNENIPPTWMSDYLAKPLNPASLLNTIFK